MEIKKGRLGLQAITLPPNKRPSLRVLFDGRYWMKVGIFMSDQDAEDFMNYVEEMIDGKRTDRTD